MLNDLGHLDMGERRNQNLRTLRKEGEAKALWFDGI